MVAPTSAGTRRRVASDTATMTMNASGTVHAAGCATSVGRPAGQRRAEHGEQHRADRRAAAGQHPGGRAEVGQPAPPDAEHQQRAEARRRDREGQPDHLRDVQSGHVQRQHHRHDRRRHRGEPEVADRAAAEHVGGEHPGDAGEQPGRGGQERGERAGRDQRAEQLARSGRRRAPRRAAAPPPRRSGRSSAAAGCRSGRARRRGWGAGRTGRPGRARPGWSGGPRRRPGWCRSGPARAAGPWCRGTWPGSASRWRTARGRRRRRGSSQSAARRSATPDDAPAPGHRRRRSARRRGVPRRIVAVGQGEGRAVLDHDGGRGRGTSARRAGSPPGGRRPATAAPGRSPVRPARSA